MKEITIEYLFKLFVQRLFLILLSAIIFAAAAFGYCQFVVDPVYRVNSQIVVSNGAVIIESELGTEDSKINGNDIQSSFYLADVCVGLLQTQDFYKQLAEKLDNKYSYTQLDGFISVTTKDEDDLFITISVDNTSPEEAKKIANTMVTMAPDYLKEFMPLAKVMITATADNVSKVAPRTLMSTAFFFVVGMAVMYLILLIIALNDKTIKGVADFTENYNLAVLGAVPNFDSAETQGGYSYAEKK